MRLLSAILIVILCLSGSYAQQNRVINREQLIEDVRQLAAFIESVHPDPYINGGGKVAFHRLVQEKLGQIPERGMTQEEFYLFIRPLVAFVGDSHTWIRDPFRVDPYSPGGIPFYFGIVENSLYILAVPFEEYRKLIGYRLISVEGITFKEIVKRQSQAMGADNEYLLLRNLAGGVLWQAPFLRALLPEWTDNSQISIELQSLEGETAEYTIPIPKKVRYPLISSGSTIELPSTEKCDFVYDFLDDKKQTALLIIDGMNSYREAFEMWRAAGNTNYEEDLKETYRRYKGSRSPRNIDKVFDGIPSATEVFRELVQEMKRR